MTMTSFSSDNPESLPDSLQTPAPRKRLTREDRHQHLLKCAVTAYADLGVERAGHGDVAKLANVSTATVFNYFPTREVLTDAVLDHICDVHRAVVKDFNDETGSTQKTIVRLAQRYNSLIQNNPDVVKVGLNWSVSFSETMRPKYLAFQDEILELIQNRLQGTRQGLSDARIILGASTMLSMMTLDKSPEDTQMRFITRLAKALDQPD